MASVKGLRKQVAALSARRPAARKSRVPPRDPVSTLPAAFVTSTRVSKGPQSKVQSGTAWIGSVDNATSLQLNLITVNPVYWPKSFITQIAALYSQYLPLSIEVEYRPNVGTSSSGRVIFGTKWHNDMPDPAAELYSTPGGFSAPVWQPWRVKVPLSGMSRRLYDVDTPIGPDSSPFSLCWYCTTAGYSGDLFVRYSFRLFNPNPSPSHYESGVTTASTQINTGSGSILETLSEMTTSAVPWIKKRIPAGSLIRQSVDLASSVAKWFYRGEAVAQSTQSASSNATNGTGKVPSTQLQVRFYSIIEPSVTSAAMLTTETFDASVSPASDFLVDRLRTAPTSSSLSQAPVTSTSAEPHGTYTPGSTIVPGMRSIYAQERDAYSMEQAEIPDPSED